MTLQLMTEAIIYTVLYSAFLVSLFKKQGAIRQLYNYPPKIQQRAVELGITTVEDMADSARKNKPLGLAVMIAANLLIICVVNGETTFWAGFYESYLFLNVFSLFDAAIIDTVWFCHSRFWRIPGTEDMAEEYHNYWFHWKWFFIGLLSSLPLAAATGGLTVIIGLIR